VQDRYWSNPSPRPPSCYDPTTPPYRDEFGVHLYDHATIRGLLRDPHRVTSDVTEMLSPGRRERLHPVSAFVWATDRRTLSGCPGRHAALRSLMAPWFAPGAAAERQDEARAAAGRIAAAATDRPFDVHHDYAMPLVVDYLAGWLGVAPADVRYAVDDQLAAGEIFETWPMLAEPEMDDRFRAVLAGPRPGGVAAQARDLVAAGALGEREAWGVLYALSVSAVATAATITLAVGLAAEHGLWARMVEADLARGAIEEAVRLGSPFPQASRFAREPFTVGDVEVAPGEQVLMWLTAANRGLPGPHRLPLHRFDPERDNALHVGWGSGYHLCGGVHHARALALTAVTELARRCPRLALAEPWTRFVGIDDGFAAAPALPDGSG
jgi:cytochrome P450